MSQSRLDFKAVAQEGLRELAAGGWVVLHPDHQEVHLGDLALRPNRSSGARLPGRRRPFGTAKRSHRGRESAAGRTATSESRRTASSPVADRDAAACAPRTSTSRSSTRCCSATAGWPDASPATRRSPARPARPSVSSKFTLTQGAFRTFKFESLTGTVDYTPERRGDGRAPAADADGVDHGQGHRAADAVPADATWSGCRTTRRARAASSTSRLRAARSTSASFRGSRRYVTNVTGRSQANVRVTGTGYDPHADGAIEVHGGAFAIPELGTRYTGLDTRIDLAAGRRHRPRIQDPRQPRFSDDDWRNAGRARALGRRGRTSRSNPRTSRSIDNRSPSLKLDARMQLTGELRKPRLEGTVEVESGTIHLRSCSSRSTANPYSTTAADDGLAGADEAARATPPQPEPVQKRTADAVQRPRARCRRWRFRTTWFCAATTCARPMRRSTSAT